MKKFFFAIGVLLLVGGGCEANLATNIEATPTITPEPACAPEGLLVGNSAACCGNLEKVVVDHAAVVCREITGVKKTGGVVYVMAVDDTDVLLQENMTWKDGTVITVSGQIEKPNGVTMMLPEGNAYVLGGTLCTPKGLQPMSGSVCCDGLEVIAVDHAYASCQPIGTPPGFVPGACTKEGDIPLIDRTCCAGLEAVQNAETGNVTCKKPS